MVALVIATVVCESEQTVRRWLKRYRAKGLEGLRDCQRPLAQPVRNALAALSPRSGSTTSNRGGVRMPH